MSINSSQVFSEVASDFELGYIMGLVVGEGCFTHDKARPAFSIKLHARDAEPLHVIHRILGGELYGPYTSKQQPPRHCRCYLLRGLELLYALPIFHAHLPASHKRKQFIAWLEVYKDFFRQQRVRDSAAD